jgi:hypothetical protein
MRSPAGHINPERHLLHELLLAAGGMPAVRQHEEAAPDIR